MDGRAPGFDRFLDLVERHVVERGSHASLTVPLAHPGKIDAATLVWGSRWPGPPGPNVPPPGPVSTLRATDHQLVTSLDGRHWTVAAQVHGRTTGTRDTLRFAPAQARYVGVRISGATGGTPPMLEELTVPASGLTGTA